MNDKKNAIKKLQIVTRSLRLNPPLEIKEINLGSPREYLRLFHHAFLDYSPALASEILLKHGMELSSKNDKLFIDGIYKLVRDMFGYVPKLTKDQFFQTSFAQIKALMASEIIEHILERFKLPNQTSRVRLNNENSENIESLSPRDNLKDSQTSVTRKPSFKNNLPKNQLKPKPKETTLKEHQMNEEESQPQQQQQPCFENILNTLMDKLNTLTFTFGSLNQRIDNIERKIEEIKTDRVSTVTQTEHQNEALKNKDYENLSNRITIIESDLINVKQMLSRNSDQNETTNNETMFHSFVNMSNYDEINPYPKKSSLIQGLAYDVDDDVGDSNNNMNDLTINSADSTPTLSNPVKETRLSEEDRNILRAQELVNKANRLSQLLSNVI
ncbi:unnamed protein product [Brachionus calyciflorus]|uniref:Centrosomal protein of 44 kDa n=1 Tax=Brachionus calyciflorus TaxID=104777 RepID=A0A813T7C4_9BILA|nr:unnamed protein product [Brachionus calyciflorus]